MQNAPEFTIHPPDNSLEDTELAKLARALGHPHRVAILRFLLSSPGCIVGDIVEQLPVMGAAGPMPLGNVVDLEFASGPTEIFRYDRLRNVNFEIELNGVPLGEVEQRLKQLPSLKQLPAGVSQAVVGDAEAMGELFASFALAMGTGVLCIYMVLVLLFRDFVQPMTILVALVLSIPGAFLALFVTGTAISMPSMIGLIMLMGIATKNSILLVDYVIIARRELLQHRRQGDAGE